MKIIFRAKYIILFFVLVYSTRVSSQSCKKPFSISFSERTTSSIKIKWSDTNTSTLGYEIELVQRGKPRTNLPSTSLISSKEFIYSSLSPAQSYELYIRTKCDVSSQSDWNGPFLFTTVFSNPTSCQIDVPIKDFGTETFFIDINQNGILGKDVFLESVDFVIAHTWPADLKLTLEAPNGDRAILSNHNGTITDNYGDIEDLNCANVTSISMQACQSFRDDAPPYIGYFLPEENLSKIGNNTSAKGLWKLIVFDRALNDIGTIKFLNLKFNNESCVVPQNLEVNTITNNSARISWQSFIGCNSVTVSITPVGGTTKEIIFNCNETSVEIKDLMANTTYTMSISAGCATSISDMGCALSFTTTCEAPSMVESFDDANLCLEGCNTVCSINSDSWYNESSDGNQDWVVWNGKTSTDNTGPAGDVYGTGNYLYIENNPSICDSVNRVVLLSNCVSVVSNQSGCDMSFYYHMYGNDIDSLIFEISTNQGVSWESIFIQVGNQGDMWQKHIQDLTNYNGQYAIFRCTATTKGGIFGDIAIDQIEFYGSKLATVPKRFFVDNDGDGYGVENEFIDVCMSIPPPGYAIATGDCNDVNQGIYPGAPEIQCNGIDENCNGNDDDRAEFNPITYVYNKLDETCAGASNGSIDLIVTGGNRPYNIEWSNGTTDALITSLKAGVYFAKIIDTGGCILQTDFISVNASNTLSAVVTETIRPKCVGIQDGAINIAHNTDSPPYQYAWSNGRTSQNISGIGEGVYSVTITDGSKCEAKIETIQLLARPSVIADIKSQKNITCNGLNNGNVELFAINGTLPYTYTWNGGQVGPNLSNLSAGTYTCTIRDIVGCQFIKSVTISQPDSLKGQVINTNNVRCFGESNGNIKTNISGGSPPYTFLWNNFFTNDDIFDIPAGAYTLTAKDANGCTIILPSIEIDQPDLFVVDIDTIIQAQCKLGKNGSVVLSSSGGTPAYNYAWSHTLLSSNTFDDLVSGNYNLTAYDAVGCKANIPNIYIPFVNVPIATFIEVIQDNICFNQNIASIAGTVSSDELPIDYNWSVGQQYIIPSRRDTIELLPSGDYSLTVTDAEGCVGVSNSVGISDIEPSSYAVTDIQKNECNLDSSGLISLEVSGLVLPLDVLWNDGNDEGLTINHLANGIYVATITDGNDCSIVTEPIRLNSISDIVLDAEIKNEVGSNGEGEVCLSISGAISPFTFRWSNQENQETCISNLSQGYYYITISDALNCQKMDSFYVDNVSSVHQLMLDSELKLFPNPSSHYFYLKSNNPIDAVSVYTVEGIKLEPSVSVVNEKKYMVDMRDYDQGIYFIIVNSNTKFRTLKWVKL